MMFSLRTRLSDRGARRLADDQQRGGDPEQLTPRLCNVSDVIRSVDDEVIDEPEDECAAHAGGDDPAAELRPPPPEARPSSGPARMTM